MRHDLVYHFLRILATVIACCVEMHVLFSNEFSEDFANAFKDPWMTRLEVGYACGRFIGIKDHYQEVGVFMAHRSSVAWLPFVDVRGYHLGKRSWAANACVGIRVPHSSRIVGVNLYYDFYKRHRDFNRLGVGVESLGRQWDFRLNGYLLVGPRTHHSHLHVFDSFIGSFRATCREVEYAFNGLDAEIGSYIFKKPCFSLYSAAGPYYYDSKFDHFVGGQARLELQWRRYVSLEMRVSYDHVFHTQVQGKVMLSFNLDELFCGRSCRDNSSLIQPVWRNGIIFTKSCCDWTWNW
jgi:hypothetical protein